MTCNAYRSPCDRISSFEAQWDSPSIQPATQPPVAPFFQCLHEMENIHASGAGHLDNFNVPSSISRQVNLQKIGAEVGPFVFRKDSQGEGNKRPQVQGPVSAFIMFPQLLDLGVTIMAGGDHIGGAGPGRSVRF